MQTKFSSPCTQKPETEPHPSPLKSTSHVQSRFVYDPFNSSSLLYVVLLNDPFLELSLQIGYFVCISHLPQAR
jgi:hypothetical protein